MYEIFKKLCDMKGVSSYRVSKDTGIATATLSDWKNGKSTPKADKMELLAQYFGVSIDYLMGKQKVIEVSRNIPGNIEKATFDNAEEYYQYKETQRIAQEIFDDKDLRALFDAAQGSRQEDLKMARDFLKRLKETNPDA